MKTTYRAVFASFLGCSLYAGASTYRVDTVAGGTAVGDGGAGIHAPLRDAQGVALDRAGNLYIADAGDHRVRKVSPSGTISTVAGTGMPGFSGDDGLATAAQLNLPYGVAVDAAGNLYIADLGNNRVRRIALDGTISSIGGSFKSPRNVLADAAGNVYVSEFAGNRVRRINPDGTLTTISTALNSPAGLALDPKGALYVADSGNAAVRKFVGTTMSTVLGTGSAAAQLSAPTGVALDPFGNLYVADSGNSRIRKLTPQGTVSTIPVPARDIVIDAAGNLLVAAGDHVTKLLVSGATALIAGDGSYLFRGDGGLATEARLNSPTAVALDAQGVLYIADTANSRIRVVSTAGLISTLPLSLPLAAPTALTFDSGHNLLIADPAKGFIWNGASIAAGNGFPGFSGDGSPAQLASLARPSGMVAAPAGGFYFSDTGNHRIRRVNLEGIISTVAGNGSAGEFLNGPTALALDSAGNLFIADTENNRVRKLSTDNQLTTVPGLALNHPRGLAVDPSGTLWISDTDNNRVLAVAKDGTVSTPALDAGLLAPTGLASDAAGNIYVADTGNNRIRILIAPPPPVTEGAASGYSVVNSASLLAGPAAPCMLITVFGADAATAAMLFDGNPAQPIATAPGQATLQVPCGVTGSSTTLSVASSRYTLPLVAAAPALFALNAGSGQALALNADGSTNSGSNPAAAGSALSLYATGMGTPANPSGVIVGRATADILFLGDAPGLIGISQINIQLPLGLSGVQPVLVISANIASQSAVTVAIQ